MLVPHYGHLNPLSWEKGLYALSWVLVTVGKYKKHPRLAVFRAFSGNLPENIIISKKYPLPRENGYTHASPNAFEWGRGGGVGCAQGDRAT